MSDTTKTTWIAKSVNGALDYGSPFNLARLRQWLKEHPNKLLKLEPIKEYRTGSQNNLYWFFIDIIANETGNDSIDLHLFFKSKLLPRKKIVIRGKKTAHEFERETSTTELSKTEFSEYMAQISLLVDIPIPDPRELENFIPN